MSAGSRSAGGVASVHDPSQASPPWVCPGHQVPLAREQGYLICCAGHRYAVRQEIPRFVDGPTYADAFGAQWKRYRQTQLDSYTRTTISRDRARRALGEELWSSLAGREVLEVGCGAGRFTEILLSEGARVTSIDLSAAVEANQENFAQGARHRIAQADLEALPFAPRSFHVVFCLGVVQHTPSPERSIARLFDQVCPGGWVVFDHYRFQARRLTQIAPLFRQVLRRVPANTSLRVTQRLVDALLPIHRRAGRWAPVVSRISPVASYYRTYPELSDALQREWSLLDTHDSLTDWYKRLRTRRQIEVALTGIGADVELCARQGNGIEARARRPS